MSMENQYDTLFRTHIQSLPERFRELALSQIATLIDETQRRIGAVLKYAPTQPVNLSREVEETLNQWLHCKEIDEIYARYQAYMQSHGKSPCQRKFFTTQRETKTSYFIKWKDIENRQLYPGTKVSINDDRTPHITYPIEYITSDCQIKLEGVDGRFSPTSVTKA